MHKAVLSSDRVMLLLALVPYLAEHGPTTVTELAAAFETSPALLRKLVTILGTAGVPGETLTYQDDDLFDINWDAFEHEDLVSLTRVVGVDDAPRFAPAETAALVAGLHALTGVLPQEYADLARATAEKLGAALGDPERTAAITVTADREDARLPIAVSAIEQQRVLAFEYRDAAGEHTSRTVDPIELSQHGGSWYLRAHCHDREAGRTFRLDHMSELRLLDPVEASQRAHLAPSHATDSDPDQRSFTVTASLPARLLTHIQGFDPEVVQDLSADRVLVAIDAWHERAAIQLVQVAPGQIVIESPAAACAAVRDWTARALAAYDV
ncbi:WYL domain-containing protein [Leucobacter coleopterorum]|uniref:WYL domain-containing protein n=1 Tax=Leucobacter coleopterorum TaxID=2714933 RepID=A0ABX6JZK4_9MICO|nr:WYL domain-containing protein [Leucobacter coleopterorum]QIM18397.1 WYL domain-containing protein [Leucobacter coleopterorum]